MSVDRPNLASADTDRLRRALWTALPSDRHGPDCPTAGDIWEGAQGNLTPADLHALASHVAGCGVCVESWRLADALGDHAQLARR